MTYRRRIPARISARQPTTYRSSVSGDKNAHPHRTDAVLKATERQLKDVEKIYTTVSDVVRHLAEADLTGQARQKFDEAKRNLKRVEEIRYELSLRK